MVLRVNGNDLIYVQLMVTAPVEKLKDLSKIDKSFYNATLVIEDKPRLRLKGVIGIIN